MAFFKHFKIRGKLIIMTVPALLLLFLTAIIYSFMLQSATMQSKTVYYDQLYTIETKLINSDKSLYQAYCAVLRNVMGQAFNTGNTEASRTEFKECSDIAWYTALEVSESIENIPELASYEYEGMTVASEYKAFSESYYNMAMVFKDGIQMAALASYVETFNISRSHLANMISIVQSYADYRSEVLTKGLERKTIVMLLVVIVFIFATFFVIFLLTNYFRKSIISITENIRKIADKDLTSPIAAMEGADEIVKLNNSAKILQEHLSDVINTLYDTSADLGDVSASLQSNSAESETSVRNIDRSANGLADAASHTAKEVSDIASLVVTVDRLSNETAGNARNLSGFCNDISVIAKGGMDTVNNLTAITSKSTTAYNSVFDVIKSIDEKAKTISMASDIISDIASQTNLLSLNASIEAARAGEAGKGFAVVAEEIGKLANQSAESANTINAMIQELIESASKATHESSVVSELVGRQQTAVSETKTGFEAIADNLRKIFDEVDNLSNVSANLDNNITDIRRSVDSLSSISEENAATAEELSATTTTVASNIEALKQTSEDISLSSDKLQKIIQAYHIKTH